MYRSLLFYIGGLGSDLARQDNCELLLRNVRERGLHGSYYHQHPVSNYDLILSGMFGALNIWSRPGYHVEPYYTR